MELDNDFLTRHTRSMIELYSTGERDLIQTLAELQDNKGLGLSSTAINRILTEAIKDAINGDSPKRHERLLLLRSRLKDLDQT